MNLDQFHYVLPNASIEEIEFIKSLLENKTEKEKSNFINQYIQVRKDPQTILLFTLLGFVGFAGIHRLLLDQIPLGIIYFFTAGICFIGTIIDVFNYKENTLNYNKQMAQKLGYLNHF